MAGQRIMTKEEFHLLLNSCGNGKSAARNRALLAIMAGAGLRIAEALALVPADLVLGDRAQVNVQFGKGGKQRLSGIAPGMVPLLTDWLEQRSEMGFTDDQPLFLTISKGNSGDALQSSYVRHMMHRLAKRSGINRSSVRVSPHSLRHFHADALHRAGEMVGAIQQQLGHQHLVTTAIYLNHLSSKDAIEAAGRLDI